MISFLSLNDDSNMLIPAHLVQGGALAKSEAFDTVITSAAFLPRIQLYGSSSNDVKEGKIDQGNFGLCRSKDDIEKLGKSVDCIPLSWRFKAMQILDGEVLSYYNHESPEFQRVQAESDVQDSGCMFGVEFLIWLPEAKAFSTYFLSSKSSRREAKPLRGLIGKGATLKVELVKTKKYSWFAPKVSACSAPGDLPDMDEAAKEIEKFNTPKDSETEKAKEPAAGAPARER